MMKSVLSAAGLVAAASAFTQPTSQTFGSLLTPDLTSPVTTGQDYSITWAPSSVAGQTVSLVLCNGPGSNCVLQDSAIVEGIPASQGSYSWSVPCSMPEGTQQTDSGYGMLIIVDGTGEFQYSTQFSVQKGSSCSATTSFTTSAAASSSAAVSSSAVLSSSMTTSASGAPASYTTSSGWYGWSSTMNTTSTPAYTATSKYTSAPAVVTSKPVEASSSAYEYSTMASGSTAAVVTSATPKPYTGAAALPTAFANVAGIVGAAGLAMLAF
ncbi:hypothetical protein LTR70_002632 [Exophiala xenobiotica]|uniref:Yeast cell wall synthesis Kre9/Knh1-like N-terminal domain-containing protein n=1 Tax=Lithohypha guttulata TaxID=1690604 RepID=A0ABR0JZX7_9EURO|nr:hypothetical protein LTR24_008445 [Lithohypha guttulata]KAK5325252.1 hypothetical protein LTR70_002632 [Exophiala xenobiotica]